MHSGKAEVRHSQWRFRPLVLFSAIVYVEFWQTYSNGDLLLDCITYNYDLETFAELSGALASNWSECRILCTQVTACTHWVWRLDNWRNGRCHPKVSSGKITNYEEGLITGPRECLEKTSKLYGHYGLFKWSILYHSAPYEWYKEGGPINGQFYIPW